MSRIIKLNNESIAEMVKEFEEAIRKLKIADGKVSYSKSFNATNKKTTVRFTELAWLKMQKLIAEFDKEVAWHGVAKRCEGGYEISDILVYPQQVTSATVDTDQAEYEKWLMDLDDDTFNNLRMQGHSHVRMGTSPSGTDLTHQGKILEMLNEDKFYIFMIWNKMNERTIKIYDYKENTLYEDSDISVCIGDGNVLEDFIKEAKEMVKDFVYKSTYKTEKDDKPAKNTGKTAEQTSKTVTAKTKKPKMNKGGVYGSHSAYYEEMYGTPYYPWGF